MLCGGVWTMVCGRLASSFRFSSIRLLRAAEFPSQTPENDQSAECSDDRLGGPLANVLGAAVGNKQHVIRGQGYILDSSLQDLAEIDRSLGQSPVAVPVYDSRRSLGSVDVQALGQRQCLQNGDAVFVLQRESPRLLDLAHHVYDAR